MASLWMMDHFFQIEMIGPPELEMLEGYTAWRMPRQSPNASSSARSSPG